MLGINDLSERPGQNDDSRNGERDSKAADEQSTFCSTIHRRIPNYASRTDQLLVMTLVAPAMQKVHRWFVSSYLFHVRERSRRGEGSA